VRPTKLLSLVAAALIVAACAATPAGTVQPAAPSTPATSPAVVEAPRSASAPRPTPSVVPQSARPSAIDSSAPGDDLVEVVIEDFAFNPETAEARVGQRIQWSNRDGEPHTVRSADGEISSAIIVGEPFEWTVTGTPGTEIAYICSIHPAMTGTVRIGD
jgi:plastocyanin